MSDVILSAIAVGLGYWLCFSNTAIFFWLSVGADPAVFRGYGAGVAEEFVMSGGHFNYACHAISQFAADLQHELDVNNADDRDQYGQPVGKHYEPETVAVLQHCQQILELYGRLAREIEWLYSGDHSEASFLRIADQVIKDALRASIPPVKLSRKRQTIAPPDKPSCCGGCECP